MAIRVLLRILAQMLSILAALAVSSCTTPHYWWTFQNDLEHTGHVPGGIGRSALVRWDVTPGGANADLTSPVFGAIGDTFRVFIATDGTLFALHPQTGATLWSFTPVQGGAMVGAAAAVDGAVFLATLHTAPEVFALDQATGAVLWHTPLPVPGSRASVTVTAGRVLVNTDAHELYSFNAFTGAFQWKAPTPAGAVSGQESTPAVFAGRAYVGAPGGLWAFDLQTGALAWTYPLNGTPGFSSPVIAPSGKGPLVLIGDTGGTLHAVDAGRGRLVWSYPTGVSLGNTTVAVADGRVFARHYAEAIALDVTTGSLLWRKPMTLSVMNPAVGGRTVYYCDGQTAVGLDTATGNPVWQGRVPGTAGAPAGTAMAMALEILVVPNGGHVYAFK